MQWRDREDGHGGDNGGRNWSDKATSQGSLEPPEALTGRKDPLLESQEGVQPCNSDSGLQNVRD